MTPELMHDLKLLFERAGKNAEEKGFHNNWNDGEKLMLITGEVSELNEELRKIGKFDGPKDKADIYALAVVQDPLNYKNLVIGRVDLTEGQKPEGVPIEFADTWIRMMDFAFKNNIVDECIKAIDMKMAYNAKRPYMHGKNF